MENLASFIERLLTVADRRNLSPENPVTFRIDVGAEQYFAVVAVLEPNHVTLPLNVTWIVADPDSQHYRKALRRASALSFDGFRNTWAELRTYDDFISEPQFWDVSATFQLGEVQVTGVRPATETMRGIFSLNREASDHNDPVVISDTDERMSNERQALPHDHPLLPSTMLAGSTGINEFYVRIVDGRSPRAGEVLFLLNKRDEPSLDNAGAEWTGRWRKATAEDIVYDGPVVTELRINGPSGNTLNELTPYPFTVDAVFNDDSVQTSINASWEIIANGAAGTISTSTGVFTSHDVTGDQSVRIRATWQHTPSGQQHSATYELTVVDTTVTALLERIEINGPTTLNEGNVTGTYTVTAFYDDGSSRGVVPPVFTSSNSGAGSLNRATGIFTTALDVMNNQTTTLSATYVEAGITRSATLELTVVDRTVYPQSAVIQGPVAVSEGTQVQYKMIVTFTDLTTSEVSVSNWAIDNAAAGTINSSTGQFSAVTDVNENVTGRITASYSSNGRSVSAYLDISVRDEDVYPVSAEIIGPSIVDEGTAAIYQLRVLFTDTSQLIVVVDDWTSSNADVGVIDAITGEFVAAADLPSNQTTTLSVSFTQSDVMVAATRDITVRDITNYPVSVAIRGNSIMAEETWQDLELEVTYQDDSKRIRPATWTSSDTSTLTVNATGRVTAVGNIQSDRVATITAQYTEHGRTLSADLTVTVEDVTVYPTSARIVGPTTVNENTTVEYQLEVTFQGGAKRIEDVTTFSVSDPMLGTITNDGRLTSPSVVNSDVYGIVTASYTLDGVTVSAELDITVTDDTVYPAFARILGPTRIDDGSSHTYQFEVTFSNATVQVVTITNWAVTGSAANIQSTTGLLTVNDLAEDTDVVITGSYTAFGRTVSASLDVLIEDVTNYPVSAVVSGPAEINENSPATQYRLLVTFRDGTEDFVAATWTSTNSNAGTLSASTGMFVPRANVVGDVNTLLRGSYTAFGRTVRGDLTVTVKDTTAYPTSATVEGPFTVDEEQTASYTLRVVFDNGEVRVVPTETWASSNAAAGTIDNATGIFTAAVNDTRNNVTTEISATWTVDGTTVTGRRTIGVVDTSVYIDDIVIVGPATVDEGSEQQYELEVEYSDGTKETVTGFDWTSSLPTVAFIDEETGLVAASNNITSDRLVTLTASYTDSAGVTYGAERVITVKDTIWRPVSLALNGPSEIQEGGSAQYSATVTYDNGRTAVVNIDNWALSSEEFAAFEDNELIVGQVDADESLTITGSYTENGETAFGTTTVLIVNIYPVSATIKGPTHVIGGEDALYTLSIERSNGALEDVYVDTWSIVGQTDDEGNPIEVPVSIDDEGRLVTSTVTETVTFEIEPSYTEADITVSDRHSVTLTAIPENEPANPRWGYGAYAGPSLTAAHGSVSAFMATLTTELERESGQMVAYSLPDGNTYAYLAVPASAGNATFTDMANNFQGAWDGATWLDDFSNLDDKGPVEVEYDAGNGPELWYVYRTDWPGPSSGTSTFRVDFANV